MGTSSPLTYPLATVGHSDEIVSRAWQLGMMIDTRNCDTTCHPATGTAASGAQWATYATSGSWKEKAGRQPCGGCHDADAARAHFRENTYDPTPADPWSGDEQEACMTCHAQTPP